MTQNQSIAPEAATDEPASILDASATDAAPSPGRRPRHDGWTPERQAAFLTHLAECGTVAEACRAVGLSPQSAYAFRKSRNGQGFAIGWDAALLHARPLLADAVLSRALHGSTETLRRDGAVVVERHRFDNRLAMAVLTRLDARADRKDAEAETSRIVAGSFEDYVECLAAGGDTAAFIADRQPEPREAASPDDISVDSLLEQLRRWREPPESIDTRDLDPARMAAWTDDQWDRADRSGLLDRIPKEMWPDETDTALGGGQ